VKVTHGLFSVNSNPEAAGSTTVVGIYGTNRVAPFKAMVASQAVAPLIPLRKGNKKDTDPELPSLLQFEGATTAKEFTEIAGDSGKQVEALKGLPNSHFVHPQIFLEGTLRYGIRPTTSLPPGPTKNLGGARERIAEGQDDNLADESGATMNTTNSHLKAVQPPEEWCLPKGKTFGDFFNPRTKGWPILTHDKTGAQQQLCVRLMVTEKCPKQNCRNTHVKPTGLGTAKRDAISSRLTEIYRT
jgi:hypothetical protein